MEPILRSGLKKRRSELRQLLGLYLAVLLSSTSLVLLFADGGSYNIDILTRLAPAYNEDAARILQIANSVYHVDEAMPKQMKFINTRRYLGGRPGSSPPRCSSRCGHCTPCKPVHVPVKPGAPRTVPAEYYPEAWRCKCGDKLYMP